MGANDKMETPPWEDEAQDGAKDEGQSAGTEDETQDNPDGAPPQEETIDPKTFGPGDGRSWGALPDWGPETGDDGEYHDFSESKSAIAYLDRIGAKWSSMNTAVIETGADKDGYRATRVTIKFLFCGHVVLTPETPDLAPTSEERLAIWEETEWCSLVKPAEIHPGELLANPATPGKIKKAIEENRIFAFYDARTGRCTMVQERVEATAKHKKFFVPWTLWSDGRWLQRAAGGPFPFWGMDALRAADEGVRVFIHEGAKSALFAANLPTDHPWADELKTGAVHLGWISGARAPKNNDWTGLAKVLEAKKVEYAVIVADNDRDGLKALLPIAHEIHADVRDPVPAGMGQRLRHCRPVPDGLLEAGSEGQAPVQRTELYRLFDRVHVANRCRLWEAASARQRQENEGGHRAGRPKWNGRSRESPAEINPTLL